MRLAAVSLALLAACTVARANEKGYSDRLLEMNDSAGAHVELARWCEAQGLAERARVHWREALVRDPARVDAKAALERGTAAPDPADAEAPTSDAAGAYARRIEIARELREISSTLLAPSHPDAWEAGRKRVLAIRDAEAAKPLLQILMPRGLEHRKLACEALTGVPGEAAKEELVRITLTTDEPEVYLAAVHALKARDDEPVYGRYMRALGGTKKARNRSAYALGELKLWSAVPALIDHLHAPEPRVLAAPRSSGIAPGPSAYIAVGNIVTYVADAQPVIAEGAVAWDPVIGAIPVGSVLSVHNPRVIIERRIITIRGPQPAVRDALKKITGRDFGFEEEKWRSWYRNLETEQRR